jgi:hypothetical protein
VLRERQLGKDFGDAPGGFGWAGVAREPQLGGVAETAARGQLRMQDVLLRNQADAVP